jgi:hypothetical protein
MEWNTAKVFFKLKKYSVFHRFRLAKFGNSGLILRLSKFLLLPQLPQKMKLVLKWSKSTQNNGLALDLNL